MSGCYCETCKLKASIRELEDEVKNKETLRHNLSSYVGEAQTLREDVNKLKIRLNWTKDCHDRQRSTIEKYQDRVEELEDKLKYARLREENTQREQELNADLASTNRGWTKDLKELHRLRDRVKELEDEPKKVIYNTQIIDDLKRRIKELEAFTCNARADVEKENKWLKTQAKEVKELKAKLAAEQLIADNWYKRVKELEGDREILHNKRAKENEELKAENKELQRRLEEIQQAIDNGWYRKRAQWLSDRNMKLNTELAKYKTHIKELENKPKNDLNDTHRLCKDFITEIEDRLDWLKNRI